jgi:sulfur carrier protein
MRRLLPALPSPRLAPRNVRCCGEHTEQLLRRSRARLPDATQVVKLEPNDYRPIVHVIVNGEPLELREGVTVAALVTQLGLTRRRIAVEINREIVGREQYEQQRLLQGDRVEIVHFVGGG